MNALTINLPDSVDPAAVRWTVARSLYEAGTLTLEQAASMAELAPTYFKMRLAGRSPKTALTISHLPKRPFDSERVKELAKEMNIEEPWEELLLSIGR